MGGTLIIILVVIVSLLIGAIVLVQNPKGGGLAEGFQGAANIGGVKRTTDFLEKSTWVLTVVLFALCLVSSAFFDTTSTIDGNTNVDSIENVDADAGVGTEEGAEGEPAE